MFVSVVNAQDNLVPQNINFTEFVGYIPNPDRDFYKPEGYIIPVDSGTPGFPDLQNWLYVKACKAGGYQGIAANSFITNELADFILSPVL